MINSSNWRLVNGIVAFVIRRSNGENLVYLASGEKKAYENAIIKEIGNESYEKFSIDDDSGFGLKIGNEFEMYINSDHFPGGKSKYYKVMNACTGKSGDNIYFSDIFTQVENNKGDFGNKIFEPIFSDLNIGKVFFVNSEMNMYKNAFQEMRRRINCQICKKTKKWIPGHRYDSENCTYYYLGGFLSRKTGENGTFLNDNDVTNSIVHLVISEIKDSDKKISDIFKSRIFGNNEDNIRLIYSDSFPSMVDSGKELENDVKDIQDYWEIMANNTLDSLSKTNEYGFISYQQAIKPFFTIFSIQNKENIKYNLSSTLKNTCEKLIKDSLVENLITWWELSNSKSDSSVTSSNTPEINIKNLGNLFFRNLRDPNSFKNIYYTDLFNAININSLEKISEFVILNENVTDLIFNSGIKNYIKFGSLYFISHTFDASTGKYSEINIKQRVKSTNYTLNFTKLEELFSESPALEKTIKDICNKAIDNYGLGVKSYFITNIGTKKDPKSYASITVDLINILDYYDNNIPEDIVKDIISRRFWKINIDIDKGEKIQ